MLTWIVGTLLVLSDVEHSVANQKGITAALRRCLSQQSKGKPAHRCCGQTSRMLMLYTKSFDKNEVLPAIKRYLRSGGSVVYWFGEEGISASRVDDVIGCPEITWFIRMARGNVTQANEFLGRDWQTAEFSNVPLFLVLAATADTCRRRKSCRQASLRALELASELSRLHARVRQEFSQGWYDRWWDKKGEWLEQFARSSTLASVKKSIAAVQTWASSARDWVSAGQEAGLWTTLHFIYEEITDGPPCTGHFVRTNHLEGLNHGLCFSDFDPGSVRNAVTGVGFWADSDAIAHIFLLLADEFNLSPQSCRVIDVGANIGALSVLLAQLSFDVVAIEADPINMRGLVQSALRLRLDTMGIPSSRPRHCVQSPGDIDIHWMAAADRVGTLQLQTDRGDGSTSAVQWKQVPVNAGDWSRRSALVPVGLLDDLLLASPQKTRPVCMVKLDIEGSEWRALLGMQKVLQTVQVIAVEVWPRMLLRSGCRSPAMLAKAMPGFQYAYSFAPHFHERPKRLDLCRVEARCLELRFWAGWSSCINPQNITQEETANLILTREPIRNLPSDQAFHMRDAVTITDRFC